MRILVLGSSGQLGSELCSVLDDHDVVPAPHSEIDIAQLDLLLKAAMRIRPDVIINAAAYTDVDGCEVERERAFLVNAAGARNAAIAARKAGAVLVHISTDYVFDGMKEEPYVEYDAPNPLSVYGVSKLFGERMVMEQNPSSFILRVAWLYSPMRKNFVRTMLSLARERDEVRVVNDQRGAPTYAGDVARQIRLLIETECYGLYHCTSQGSCTWYDFAREVFRLAGIDVNVVPVTSAEFPRPAKRPASSVLDNFMLRIQGLDIMPSWDDSLTAHINEIREAMDH
jgi:dTDP-4-dehydrorhamnose reductase